MATTYKQNQAFEKAHEQNLGNHNDFDWMDRVLKYSNNPGKIKEFKNYVPYVIWFQELFFASQKLINKLQDINNDIENARTNWLGLFRKTKKIENCFKAMHSLTYELNIFKTDCKDFQQCMLSTNINHNTDYTDLLQEQERYLDLIESKIRQTGDRKLASINNSRMQFFGLVLSLTAVAVSVYSILNGD